MAALTNEQLTKIRQVLAQGIVVDFEKQHVNEAINTINDLLDGLQAFYGEPEIEEVVESQIEEVIKPDDFGELESISDDYLTYQDGIELLESKAEISPEMRSHLEKEQDIGLILAIIEAVE